MSLAVYHHGRPLTKEQLAIYSGLLADESFLKMSLNRQLTALDKSLAAAGMPVTPLLPGDKVSWDSKGKKDSGTIVSVDSRARKVRVRSSSLHRDITVAMDTIRAGED